MRILSGEPTGERDRGVGWARGGEDDLEGLVIRLEEGAEIGFEFLITAAQGLEDREPGEWIGRFDHRDRVGRSPVGDDAAGNQHPRHAIGDEAGDGGGHEEDRRHRFRSRMIPEGGRAGPGQPPGKAAGR